MNNVVDFLYSPATTDEQRVKFAILCAMEVCDDLSWRQWAEKWLSGEDRSQRSAAESHRDVGGAMFLASRAAVVAVDPGDKTFSATTTETSGTAAYEAYFIRKHEIADAAKRWSPENWREIYSIWYRDRQIDFSKLIEKARL